MDIRKIRQLAKLLHSEDLQELEIQDGDNFLRLKRANRKQKAMAGNATQESPGTQVGETSDAIPESSQVIRSPLAGTFYRSKSPGAPPLVSIGDEVRCGKTLCILEAMKLMNELEAPEDGRIIEILAQNAEPVQEGQPLFRYIPI